MVSIERLIAQGADMEARLVAITADNERMRAEFIEELTEELEHETNPYSRESLQRHIDEVRAIGSSPEEGHKRSA